VGAASGRVDAVVFMGGLIAGVWVFAEAWVALEGFVGSGALESATFADLVSVPFWVLALVVVAIALGTFWLIGTFEQRREGTR
jgi:hypothetical protein